MTKIPITAKPKRTGDRRRNKGDRHKPGYKTEIPMAFLRECFDADFEAGALTWRARPGEHFPNRRAWNTWNVRYAGRPALAAPDGKGSRGGVLTFNGRTYRLRAHRVAWALATGAWPVAEIDHKNGDTSDNRFANLREATRAEIIQNAAPRSDNTSGVQGVYWNKQYRKWQVQITVKGRRKDLGRFGTLESARAAYLKAKARLHPFQPVPR
jgi:hypothetical protein